MPVRAQDEPSTSNPAAGNDNKVKGRPEKKKNSHRYRGCAGSFLLTNELLCLQLLLGAFLLTIGALHLHLELLLLAVELPCLQWECASNKYLKRL